MKSTHTSENHRKKKGNLFVAVPNKRQPKFFVIKG